MKYLSGVTLLVLSISIAAFCCNWIFEIKCMPSQKKTSVLFNFIRQLQLYREPNSNMIPHLFDSWLLLFFRGRTRWHTHFTSIWSNWKKDGNDTTGVAPLFFCSADEMMSYIDISFSQVIDVIWYHAHDIFFWKFSHFR